MRSNIHRLFWIVLCSVGASSVVHARTETIRWSQAEPSLVSGFEVRWGTAPGSYPNVLGAGLPTPDASGVYSYALTLPDTATAYVVVRARDTQGYLSAFSNEKVLSPPDAGGSDPATGWSQDFESAPLGTSVAGWIDTDAKDSLTENDSLFWVTDLNGNRVMTTDSGQLNIHSHATGGGSWSNYEFRGRMRLDDPVGSVGVTAYSAYPNEDVYYKLFRIGENTDSAFWIVGHPDITCDTRHTGVDPVATAWYQFRLEVRSNSTANQIRAKVWRTGTNEPTAWQATCLDESPTRPTSGTVGLWSRGRGSKYWDDLEVVAAPALEEGATGGGTEGELGAPGRPLLVSP